MKLTGIITTRNNQYIVAIDSTHIENRGYAKVKIQTHNRVYTTFAGSVGGNQPSVIIPLELVNDLNLHIGDKLDFEIEIVTRDLPNQRVHPLLKSALQKEDLTLEYLPDNQKRQLLSSVNEAQNNLIRTQRIEAILKACRDHSDK